MTKLPRRGLFHGACLALLAPCAAPELIASSPQGPEPQSVSRGATAELVRAPLLPRAVSSFGAAVQKGFLYVYGGHVGRAHDHSRANHVGSLWRLNLADGQSWEQLPDGQSLQGTALVALPDGDLLQVGGMHARNEDVTDEDLISVAAVCRFDVAGNVWRDAVPLPEPRSSHDAIAVGGTVYVAGGWSLRGNGQRPQWLRTAWRLDTTAEEQRWEPLPEIPASRRACQLARFGDTVALVGGMDEDAEFLRDVLVLDLVQGAWVPAAPFPSMPFGAAAVGVGEALYASGMDGQLFRLVGRDAQWEPITTLAFPRFFHRIVKDPAGNRLVALGGAGSRSHTRLVEYLPLDASAAPLVHEWTLPLMSPVDQRAGVTVRGEAIYILGGNQKADTDRFANSRLVAETVRIDLDSMRPHTLAPMPGGRQSFPAMAVGGRGTGKILAMGGMGPGAGKKGLIEASAEIHSLDVTTGQWAEVGQLPTPRTAFHCLEHGGELWLFGGMDFRPEAEVQPDNPFPLEILRAPIHTGVPNFRPSGAELPGPRRSFGSTVWEGKAVLLGGIARNFDTVRRCELFDFATKTWGELPEPPKAWVSAQLGVIGKGFYVACGGTMTGRRFREDRSLVSYSEASGWQTLVLDLGFSTRHVQMQVIRDRLWFVDTRGAGKVTLRSLRPSDAPVQGQAIPFH